MKKQTAQQIFLSLCGILLVITGILVSEPIIASFTEDGEIGSRVARISLWALSLSFILAGIFTLLLRRSAWLFRVLLVLSLSILLLAALDYGLYLFAPWLPAPMVRLMTPQAQLRYFQANEEEIPWEYEENFRRARPGAEILGVAADEYGYRNPAGYLQAGQAPALLLVGDSFVWGTGEETIADHLRQAWPERTTYAMGIFGNSMSQWRYHFADFVAQTGTAPQTVVFNFYAGNDLSDTKLFRRVHGFGRADPAIVYYTFYNSPWLVPAEAGGFALPKIPEIAAIALALLMGGEQAAAEPTRLRTSYTIDDAWPLSHEPLAEEFDELIWEELALTVQLVKELAPETQVVISYIPTISAVYGSLLADCPWCDGDVAQQAANAAMMAAAAAQLGADFVDVTPALQRAARETPLWAPDGHFSEAGYALYAQALGEALFSGGD